MTDDKPADTKPIEGLWVSKDIPNAFDSIDREVVRQ